jgi:hypothetical protein
MANASLFTRNCLAIALNCQPVSVVTNERHATQNFFRGEILRQKRLVNG